MRSGRLLGWAALAWLACAPLVALASHDGPVFYVDENNPPEDDTDGDHHFHSLVALLNQRSGLQRGDTVLLAPGRYLGDLVIAVEGVTIQATEGAQRTQVVGNIQVTAEGVRLEGFSLDTTGAAQGIWIQADQAQLRGLQVFGAQVGVLIRGEGALRGVELVDNRLYHNATGIVSEGARHLTLRGNRIEANAQAGGAFSNGFKLDFEGNIWNANGGDGLRVENAFDVELDGEAFEANGGHGLALVGASGARIAKGRMLDNGGLGVEWGGVQDSALTGSQLQYNRLGGLRIGGRSQNNRVEGNEFSGHSRPEAAGVWLRGPVFDNAVVRNAISDNRVGVLFEAQGQAPANNRIEANHIARASAQGVEVIASGGNNVFSENVLEDNNGTGFHHSGGHDTLSANRITGSGGDGFWLDGAASLTLRDNVSSGNRGNGLRLGPGASGVRVETNRFADNHENGLQSVGGSGNRFADNAIEANRRNGVALADERGATLSGNQVAANGGWGVLVEGGSGLDLSDNQILDNHWGGMNFIDAQGVEAEGNELTDNLNAGLRVERGDVWARRNWWGDPLGPAGAFAGAGNAVVGLALERVLPWLPDVPQRIEAASVIAQALDTLGPGQTLWLDAVDRAGLSLEVSGVGVDAQGERRPLSLGVLLLARYRDLNDLTPLSGAVAAYSVQIGGVVQGAATLRAVVPAGSGPLRLWLLRDGKWDLLPGGAYPALGRASGDVEVGALRPGLIALAPTSAGQDQAATPPVGGDVALLGGTLLLLGLRRVSRGQAVRWALARLAAAL